MSWLTVIALFWVGFTACAEFGSYAFVHPVIRHLPMAAHLQVEQGLLRTFGRVMPAAMTGCPVLTGSYAAQSSRGTGWAWAATVALVCALATTIVVNVGINRTTGTWDPLDPPPDWKRTRDRWERFQGIRSWLLLLGFAGLCLAVGTA